MTIAIVAQGIIRQYVTINRAVVLLVHAGSWLLSFLISYADSGPNLMNNNNTRWLNCVTEMKPDGPCL